MLTPKCPTCKTRLADKQIPYAIGMEKICANQTISDAEKEKQKMELLNKLEVLRYCCRMRLLTFTNLPDLLV